MGSMGHYATMRVHSPQNWLCLWALQRLADLDGQSPPFFEPMHALFWQWAFLSQPPHQQLSPDSAHSPFQLHSLLPGQTAKQTPRVQDCPSALFWRIPTKMVVELNNDIPVSQEENVSREKNASNQQPRNLDSSCSPATDIVCPPLESCQTSWHLSFFLSKDWGGIQQSLGCFQSKRLYSSD